MASTFDRGTKDRPKWNSRFKDANGVWRSKLTHQPTRALAEKVTVEIQAREERLRLGLEEVVRTSPMFGPLMEQWSMGLVNRSSRDDVGRLRLHVLPRFKGLHLEDVTLSYLLKWLDEERTGGRISPQTLRHCLALVSRFFNWAIRSGLTTVNPVHNIPSSQRPKLPKIGPGPRLENDLLVPKIMETLPDPFRLMFFIGNRCGARVGEICGLRLSDLATLGQGSIRLRFSYTGPLKEDRRGTGKEKLAPAPADAVAVLGPWIARRRGQEAGDEAFLFERPSGGHYRKEALEAAWSRARTVLGLGTLTFYQATRHSFIVRNLERGVAITEVSAALGHATPAYTLAMYPSGPVTKYCPAMLGAMGGEVPTEPVFSERSLQSDGTDRERRQLWRYIANKNACGKEAIWFDSKLSKLVRQMFSIHGWH